MVVHRFGVNGRQVKSAQVGGRQVNAHGNFAPRRQVVYIAVYPVVPDILVVDPLRETIGRMLVREAGVEYFPSGRENL